MTVTFLVAIKLNDLSTLSDTAADIEDDLNEAGYEVDSVKPWARPATGTPPVNPLAALPSMLPTPTENQTQTQNPIL